MRADVELALGRSAQTFRDVVWPAICGRLGGGRLVPVETVTQSGFATLLDTLGGTDAWQVVDGRGMRSLATARQIDAGYLIPQITVQAYVAEWGGPLLAAAAIRTERLYAAASAWLRDHGEDDHSWRCPRDGYFLTSVPGGNTMLVVPWSIPGAVVLYRDVA